MCDDVHRTAHAQGEVGLVWFHACAFDCTRVVVSRDVWQVCKVRVAHLSLSLILSPSLISLPQL